jgi:hypothetical protein
MENVLTLALETSRAIRHDAFALRCSDLSTKVCLARYAELALPAFGGTGSSVRKSPITVVPHILESDDMVTRLYGSNAFAHGLHNACAFVSKYDWKCSFRVFARQSVCICESMSADKHLPQVFPTHRYGTLQCSIFRFGPHGPLVGQPRHPRERGLCQLPTQPRPVLHELTTWWKDLVSFKLTLQVIVY